MALHRYRIVRGRRSPDEPLPPGIRQDTRKHTRHFLRPTPELVERYLDDPTDARWDELRTGYVELLRRRFTAQREAFDKLAELALREDVYLGCNCPTKQNPDVARCHTVLALTFLKERYPRLTVVFP